MLTDTNPPQQRLLPLFHHAPMGMAETDAQGAILQVNPKAVQLMMPMAAGLGLPGDNLLDTLAGVVPSIRQTIADFEPDSGLIIEQELYPVRLATGAGPLDFYLSLTIEKVSPGSLLIFFSDVTSLPTRPDPFRQHP